MIKKVHYISALIAMTIVMHTGAIAQNTGIFQTYAVVNANGSGNQFLAGGINSDGASSIFSGFNFGSVTSLVLNGGEVKTFKNGPGDVFGAEISYNVHLSAGATGAFNTINLPFESNLPSPGDQRWQQTLAGVDLLAGLGCGTYDLEVFWRSPTNQGDNFDSNFGNNYTATFTIEDTQDPVITCSGDLIVEVPFGQSNAIVNFNTTATDNCTTTPSVVCSPASGSSFALGTTLVNCTATDDAANEASCSFSVTVIELSENEDCSDAIAITPSIWGEPAWETFALGTTQSLPGCTGDADDDIWFSFTANSSNDAVIAQDPALGYNAVIEIYEGCGGASLGCYNAYGSGAIERALPGGLTPGQEYYFRVYDAASGPSASTNVRVMVKTYEDSQLRAPSCGATGLLLNQVIYSENDGSGQLYSNPAVGVNGYAYRFQEQGGGLDVTVQRPVSNGWYFQLVNAGLEYGKSYDVTVSHRVIIQANGFVDQYWSQFGTVCSISMAATVPTTQLRAQYCTGDDYFLSDQLFADVVTGASNYRFTFVPSGPYNTLQEVSANYAVSLQNVGSTGNRLLYGVSYTVTVEALVNGTWSAPGSACVIFMSSQPEDTSVRASYCGDDYAYPSSNFILAESVVGATAYEFQFSPQPSGMALTKLVPTVSFTFGLSSLPFVVGTTYNVQVRAFSGVTAGDFVDTGCEITILAPPMMAQESMTSEEEIKASALTHTLDYSLFPNPNDGTEFMVQRMDGSFSEGAIGIEILDITGKVLHTEMKAVKGDSRLLVDPASDLRKGLYLLRVTDEKGSQTLRFTVD